MSHGSTRDARGHFVTFLQVSSGACHPRNPRHGACPQIMTPLTWHRSRGGRVSIAQHDCVARVNVTWGAHCSARFMARVAERARDNAPDDNEVHEHSMAKNAQNWSRDGVVHYSREDALTREKSSGATLALRNNVSAETTARALHGGTNLGRLIRITTSSGSGRGSAAGDAAGVRARVRPSARDVLGGRGCEEQHGLMKMKKINRWGQSLED